MRVQKQIFLVPYAHLDTQWRWEYPTTIEKYISSTIHENFARFDQFPDYQFNFTGALRYAMMKEYFPAKFERVRELVSEERWHLAGTCLEETDALLPSCESMIRNILYGQRWSLRELRSTSRDYMIPDCFGFPANMPTVLAHCGIIGFSSQKLTWNSAVGIPFELGRWRGPDGSEIVSALNPGRYDSHLPLPIHLSRGRLSRLERMGRATGIWKSLQYYGVGDIGGAPARGSVRRALASIRHGEDRDDRVSVRQGGTTGFFEEITRDERDRMYAYVGDLLLVNHSAGVLTSAAIMKRWNRRNEQMAYAAEAAATIAALYAGALYPAEKIERAWWRVIGTQMHDILPGTSTPTAYEFSQNDELVALNTWAGILEDSARAIAPLIVGDGDILLFNPLAEQRSDAVDFILLDGTTVGGAREAGQVCLVGTNGQRAPTQVRVDDLGRRVLTAAPTMKGLSWARFSVADASARQNDQTPEVTLDTGEDGYVMDNGVYRVHVDTHGSIDSIHHHTLSREVLASPIAYHFQAEKPRRFPAWNMDWSDRRKPPVLEISQGEVTVVEDGPIRCTLRIEARRGASTLVREVSLTAGAELVEFVEYITWRETGCSLKLALQTPMEQPAATFNWETARIAREVNHSKCFEMPSRLWADLSEDGWGVSIIEDSKYGYDRPSPDMLRLTLLYTPETRFLGAFRDQGSQDWGSHTVRYALYAHHGDWRSTDRVARAFNQPIHAFRLKKPVRSPKTDDSSLFSVSNDQLGVMSVKRCEDRPGILVRFYERCGKDGAADVVFSLPVERVTEVNGLEESIEDVQVDGRQFTARVGANGIRAFAVELTGLPSGQTDQQPLALPYNHRLFTNNGEDGEGGEPGAITLPAELAPDALYSGAVRYEVTASAACNALLCAGQDVSLPGGYQRLYILAAAVTACRAAFTWVDNQGRLLGEAACTVPAMTGFVGQWDRRLWKHPPQHLAKRHRDYIWANRCVGVEPGYVNRERVEWFSTHTHRDGGDQAYRFGYLYTVTLEMPESARAIRLPADGRIRIVAMSAANPGPDLVNVRYLRDRYDY